VAVLAPLTACGTAETEPDESSAPEQSVSGGEEAETKAVPETEVVRVDTLVDTLVDGPAKTDLEG